MRSDLFSSPEDAADRIRKDGGYRWVGIYAVGSDQIEILSWSGGQAPAYPRFPRDRGLCGAAVATLAPVVVGDVRRDPRYLTTFGTTRSEIVVPVKSEVGEVIGLIDVESDRVDAFTTEDERALVEWAARIAPLLR